jgi:hypothetical protein
LSCGASPQKTQNFSMTDLKLFNLDNVACFSRKRHSISNLLRGEAAPPR